MPYPTPTPEQILRFERDGFLVVTDAVDQDELLELTKIAHDIIERRHELARDWDWRRGEALEERQFRIVQSFVTGHYPWIEGSALRTWAARFGSALMGKAMTFWYDQFLGKPPIESAPTPWHQDEAYWGRGVWNGGVTCWMALHDVGPENGCMHFMRGGHAALFEHKNPPEMASDLLTCNVPMDAEIVVCPLKAGSVTFHHSRTPHMTLANTSGAWRLSLAQHFCLPECKTKPVDSYPWRILVDQQSLERIRAVTGDIERLK